MWHHVAVMQVLLICRTDTSGLVHASNYQYSLMNLRNIPVKIVTYTSLLKILPQTGCDLYMLTKVHRIVYPNHRLDVYTLIYLQLLNSPFSEIWDYGENKTAVAA